MLAQLVSDLITTQSGDLSQVALCWILYEDAASISDLGLTTLQPTTVSLGNAGEKEAPGSFPEGPSTPLHIARLWRNGLEARPIADPHTTGLAQLCTSLCDDLGIRGGGGGLLVWSLVSWTFWLLDS